MSVMIIKRTLRSEQDRLTVNKGYFNKTFNECDDYQKNITECHNFNWYTNLILLDFILKLKISQEIQKFLKVNISEYINNNNSNNNNSNNNKN